MASNSNFTPKHKVIVVGWDGAEPKLIQQLLAEERLPNLQALIQHGYMQPVKSTIRPESSVAWTTFATGVNPGVHGVYSFMRHVPKSYQTELNDSTKVHVPFFWESLSRAGKRVAIMNMPMVYPPRPVNGWIVCGLMTPGPQSVFTFPPELGTQLLDRGYTIDTEVITASEDRARYAERMNEQVRQRTTEAISLMQNGDWDFGAIIYTELDRLQHFYWADMDPQHPLRPPNPVPNGITDHYVELDNALGQIMHMADSEATLILMSDHGFSGCSRQFCVNQWLAMHGWLCLKSGNALSNLVSKGLKGLKGVPLVHKLKRALLGKQSLIEPFQKQSFYNQIDWSRTRAWYSETSGIRINLCGREPLGIVESDEEYRTLVSEIIAQALALRDPLQDKLVFQGAYRREEIYNGPQLGSAPDIILNTFHDDVYQNHVPTAFPINLNADLFKNSLPYTGTHTDFGICASNAVPTFAINDLQDITKWIMSLFHADSSMVPPLENTAHDANVYNADDEARVKDRLRSLGYLD